MLSGNLLASFRGDEDWDPCNDGQFLIMKLVITTLIVDCFPGSPAWGTCSSAADEWRVGAVGRYGAKAVSAIIGILVPGDWSLEPNSQ